MGILGDIGGFVKNKVVGKVIKPAAQWIWNNKGRIWNEYIKAYPERLYNNIKDNWHYINRIPGDSWTAKIVRGGLMIGGIMAGVSAATVTSGHPSVIASMGCMYHSTQGYTVQQMCSMEACKRMNPPVCQQVFPNQPPPPSSSNQSAPPLDDNLGQPAPSNQSQPEPPPQPPKPPPTDTPIPYSRCDLFDSIDISYVFHDIKNCSNKLTVGFKFPDGVPGIDGPSDGGDFTYTAQLGQEISEICDDHDYENQLFCDFSLPSGYENSIKTLELFVTQCEDSSKNLKPVFTDTLASVPAPEGCRAEEDSQGVNPQIVCSAATTEAECLAAGGAAIGQNGVYSSCYCED